MVSECAGPASAVFWQGVRLGAHADQKRHVRGRLRSSPDWHPTIAWPSLSLDTGPGPSDAGRSSVWTAASCARAAPQTPTSNKAPSNAGPRLVCMDDSFGTDSPRRTVVDVLSTGISVLPAPDGHLYTREPPSPRDCVRRTIVQVRMPSSQPALTCRGLEVRASRAFLRHRGRLGCPSRPTERR